MKKFTFTAGGLLLMLIVSVNAGAGAHTLKTIMQDLGDQVGRLARAIMADDLETAGAAAAAIADHPKPDMGERLALLARIGTDVAAFRQRDTEVHDAATAVKRSAEAGDRAALARDFHRLTDACLGCHNAFRDVFRRAGSAVSTQ